MTFARSSYFLVDSGQEVGIDFAHGDLVAKNVRLVLADVSNESKTRAT
jgi:hypothetical protein